MSDQLLDTTAVAAPMGARRNWLVNTMLGSVRHGRLTLVTPSGSRLTHAPTAPGPEGTIVLHRWRTLRRLLTGGDIAGGETYMDGDWSSPDLPSLIELVARNDSLVKAIGGSWLARAANRLLHRLNANTRRGSRRNIVRHYDLGNDFYAAWLDPGMTYSSGLYRTGSESLAEAQAAKQDRAIELLALRGDELVLEIGCGWGGLIERLATIGMPSVTGVTLSPAQLGYATSRVPNADLRLQDYRDISGTFDRIVSIEMLEAVGEAWWPSYFRTLRDRLSPGGIAVLQAITIAEDRFETYRGTPDFIQRYIFPGGMLPSQTEMRSQIAKAGLELRSVETFGDSYARTLAVWRQRFLTAWPSIASQGFDQRFKRMWDYYLAYCEAGFRAGATDVGLYRVARPCATGTSPGYSAA